MKGKDRFKEVIKEYLDDRAAKDALFAERYANTKKNIDDCAEYIFSEVKKSGRMGFADEEIYGIAVHYYDEDNLQFENVGDMEVIVNQAVELTEEEKAKARQEAFKAYRQEQLDAIRNGEKQKNEKKQEAKPKQESQLDLFNMLSDEA